MIDYLELSNLLQSSSLLLPLYFSLLSYSSLFSLTSTRYQCYCVGEGVVLSAELAMSLSPLFLFTEGALHCIQHIEMYAKAFYLMMKDLFIYLQINSQGYWRRCNILYTVKGHY